ncbi:MAG: methyltransferase domain-containing protein [Alphaproteobacteria bacterium]
MSAADSHYYENPAHWTADRYLTGFERQRLQTCVDLIPRDTESLVDIGCGNGAFLRHLQDISVPPRNLFGLDRSNAALTASLCAAPMTAATAQALPFPDRAVHMACALDVIEHLPFGIYQSALDEIARIAGRYILINVPYRERRLTVTCPNCGCGFNPHYHMRSFDEAVLAGLFTDFEPLRMVKTKRRENLLFLAVRPFRRHVFGPFPATAICPQCTYSPAPDTTAPTPDTGWRGRIKALAAKLPAIAMAAEIAVLYRRREAAGPLSGANRA